MQEVRFDENGGVSYEKGCYTGQETVARLHFRGHTNRDLRGLAWSGTEPLTDAKIMVGEKEVGSVRSILTLPTGRLALALIRREVETGQVVTAGGLPASVVALPFPLLVLRRSAGFASIFVAVRPARSAAAAFCAASSPAAIAEWAESAIAPIALSALCAIVSTAAPAAAPTASADVSRLLLATGRNRNHRGHHQELPHCSNSSKLNDPAPPPRPGATTHSTARKVLT